MKKFKFPEFCPVCESKLSMSDTNIICTNEECSGAGLKKFIFGVRSLGMENFGPKTLEKFYACGITEAIKILSVDENFLLKNGFGLGRSSEILLNEIKGVKSLKLEQVLLSLGIENLGNTISKKIANWYFSKQENFKGMQKNIVENFLSFGEYYQKLENTISYLKSIGIDIEIPDSGKKKENPNLVTQYIELTGSPKSSGYNTKEDFLKYANKFGYEYSKLDKKSSYLVTDSYDFDSSKMQKAKKLGIEIITYTDFLSRHK